MHPLLNSPRKASSSRLPPPAPSSGSRRTSLVADHVSRTPRRSFGDPPVQVSSPDEHERQSRASHRTAPSAGFYLPPPGYVDTESRKGSKEIPQIPRMGYGGQGTWHQTASGWSWVPTVGDLGKNPAAQWVEENVMPALSHHDWSIPQAKQILSHWATLATLLAGTQATLMGYYQRDVSKEPGYTFVIASSCAGLFLEVYGALLAAITIVASISLQARRSSSFPNPASDYNRLSLSPPSSQVGSSKPLSPRATAILDRMTVACGYIIPLGAICELIGLGAYAARYQNASVAISIVVTLVFCILVTLFAAFLGWRAGSERANVLKEVRHRARYWNDGRQYTTPAGRNRGDEVEDEEEGAGLINSI